MTVTNQLKVFLQTIGLLLLLSGGYGAWRWYKIAHYPKWLTAVQIGDTEASVLELMGMPDKRRKRPETSWLREGNCDHAFLYGRSAPPQWWAVGFSAEGLVVSKAKVNHPID